MKNRRDVLTQCCIPRIGLTLQYAAGKYMTTGDALNHLQKSDPVLRELFVLMNGVGDLGTTTKHTLYDILQEAIARALPDVTLAFRDKSKLEDHKTLSETGKPSPFITAFQNKYVVKTSGARLFLHLAPATPLPSESSIHIEGLAANLVSSLDIESAGSVKLTNAISAAKHLLTSFSAQFPSLATLLPVAEERLSVLEATHQHKRRCIVQSSVSGPSPSREWAHECALERPRGDRGVSEELRSDRDYVMEIVKNRVNGLEFLSTKLRDDKDVVMTAVKQNGRALKYASEDLRSDREVVVAAVEQDGRALEYASEDLKRRLVSSLLGECR